MRFAFAWSKFDEIEIRSGSSEHCVKVVDVWGFYRLSLIRVFHCSDWFVAKWFVAEFLQLWVYWFVVFSKWLFYHAVFEWLFLCVVVICHFEVHVSGFEDGWTLKWLFSGKSVFCGGCPFKMFSRWCVFYKLGLLILLDDSQVLLEGSVARWCFGNGFLLEFVGWRSDKCGLGVFRLYLRIIMSRSYNILWRRLFPPLCLEYKSHENNGK